MKFSIIIPVYKVEKYLPQCVDSVLSQTYTDYEIILVDDGSPDDCPHMCDEYARKDSRIKVIHQENAGIACARNTGIKGSTGKYVVFIDSDDFYISTDFLEELDKHCTNDVDIVQYGYSKFYAQENKYIIGEIPLAQKMESPSGMLNRALKANAYCGCAWTKAARRELVIEHELFFKPGMVAGEDIDWFLNVLCEASSISSINSAFVAYRQREDSASHAPKIISLVNNLWILNKWTWKIEEIKDDYFSKQLLGVMAYYYANDLILFSTYPLKETKPYRKELKRYGYLLKSAQTPRAKTVRKFFSIFGFDITILVLKALNKIK